MKILSKHSVHKVYQYKKRIDSLWGKERDDMMPSRLASVAKLRSSSERPQRRSLSTLNAPSARAED